MTTSVAAAATAGAAPHPTPCRPARRPLGAYRDHDGRQREVVARPGAQDSVLVIDEDAETLGDRRLVAHLAGDEPPVNALVVCRLYVAAGDGRFARPVVDADWTRAPGARVAPPPSAADAAALVDGRGRSYRLAIPVDPGDGELRWIRTDPDGRTVTVGLRAVVGALESYGPACPLTEAAVREPPQGVSTLALAGELQRLRRSRSVLNRRLREAVQAAVRDGLSLSQIAARCGRPKSRRTAGRVGDTSWLGRRVGLLPEVGQAEPSPWIHADVLARIARDGLGIDPRHVELT